MTFGVKVFIVLISVWKPILSNDWNYGNISEWPGYCQTGNQQSPINLVPQDSSKRIYSALDFINYDVPHSAKVKNNGHSVAITLQSTKNRPKIRGGGLGGLEYMLDHLHFHWESEHTVNGYRYPLEMHLVHYADKYDNLSYAANYPSGVAVLGVLFDLSIDDDKDFVPLIEVMEKVEQYPELEVDLERQITARSFLPRNTAEYFRYHGSLTTPNCNEGVIWTVFIKTLPISADQYEHFEAVWSKDGPLSINYRPIQDLNGRVVTIRVTSPIRITPGGSSASTITAFSVLTTTIFGIISIF